MAYNELIETNNAGAANMQERKETTLEVVASWVAAGTLYVGAMLQISLVYL